MEILFFLLSYPLGIFTNISTDFLVTKLKGRNDDKIFELFKKSFVSSLKKYVSSNKESKANLNLFCQAIINNPSKLKESIQKIEYPYLSIIEIRSDFFIESITTSIIFNYGFPLPNNITPYKKIIDLCLKEYESNFLSQFLNSPSELILHNTLGKVYNSMADKADIEKLRELIIKSDHIEAKDNKIIPMDIWNYIVEEIGNPEPIEISDPIKFRMRQLNKIIDNLTEDQFRIVNHMRYHNRMHITGCAGSGKTIIAAEKAIRLDSAGIKTLITCFNPYLATHIKGLVSGTSVDVIPFSDLHNHILNTSYQNSKNWHIYLEPSEYDIEKLFEIIIEFGFYYDAIIVDEGQDFLGSWWIIIDALLDKSKKQILYVFSDDNQQIKNIKSKYPIDYIPSELRLIKNVRNAGEIFKLISQFHPDAPPPTVFLEGFGITKLNILTNQILDQAIQAINDAFEYIDPHDIVILTLSNKLKREIENDYDNRELALAAPLEKQINNHLEFISRQFLSRSINFKITYPLDKWDIKKIQELTFQCSKKISKLDLVKNQNTKYYWQKFRSNISSSLDKLEYNLLKREGDRSSKALSALDYFHYYYRNTWIKQLPEITSLILEKSGIKIVDTSISIPIIPIENYKGLEAKGVILIIDQPIMNLETFLYVGISRAVYYLNILIDTNTLVYIQNTGRKLKN